MLTTLDNDTTWNGVKVSEVVSGGFALTEAAAADDITDGLSVLPSVVAPMLTYRGVADDQEANSWTMSFSSNEGAVAELVCVPAEGFVGYCEVRADTPTIDMIDYDLAWKLIRLDPNKLMR